MGDKRKTGRLQLSQNVGVCSPDAIRARPPPSPPRLPSFPHLYSPSFLSLLQKMSGQAADFPDLLSRRDQSPW